MSDLFAALPMYDWPQIRAEVDAEWAAIRRALLASGVDAPERLVRRNGDMPPVPGGIRDASGAMVAPDPAMLPPDERDFPTIWQHPNLLFGQTCWGPIELGLVPNARVVGQPDYSAYEGGQGALYSSAIVMRRGKETPVPAPDGASPSIPLDLIRGKRFAFNSRDSMSGMLALTRDLAALGETLAMFSRQVESGAHHASVLAVAEGRADVATIDCRSWDLVRRFEPRAGEVVVVGWTGKRKGLPYITSRSTPEALVAKLSAAVSAAFPLEAAAI